MIAARAPFTTRAAGELRTRLRQLGASGVQARTFHAAALAQLSHFWPQVVGGSLPRILDGKARLLGQAQFEAIARHAHPDPLRSHRHAD